MRIIVLSFFLLSVGSMFAQKPLDQRLDFSIENRSIPDAIDELASLSGISIAYSKQFFIEASKRTLNFQQTRFETILKAILGELPIDYKVQGQRILLFRKKKDRYILSGYLRDERTQERLIGATVYSPLLNIGATTNEYGFYSLSLPPGTTALEYRYLGYEPKSIQVHMDADQRKNIGILPSSTLQEVTVVAGADEGFTFEGSTHANYDLSKAFLQNVPSLGGEKDVLRAAQLLAGIQSGSDGLGGIQVRGSENGHNLMLMDGVPVYIPFHLMGALSVYNAQTVQSARVLKGSFSSKYGGRLSSVFDIRTRDGNKSEWDFQVGGNFLNAQAVIEGPIIPGESSILVAARYLPADFLLRPSFSRIFFEAENDELDFNFYDLNVKWNWAISEKDHLYLSYFRGTDNFGGSLEYDELDEYEFSLGWQNQTFALRWNHVFNGKVFSNLTLTRSLYDYNYSSLYEFEDEEEEEIQLSFYGNASRNLDLALKLDFDYLINTQHQLHFGAGISAKTFEPESVFFDENEEFVEDLDTFNVEAFEEFYEFEELIAFESFAYLEDHWTPNSDWRINLGFRLSSFTQEAQSYFNLEPRFSTQYQINPNWSMKAAYSRMVQYLHLISNSSLRLPNDIWLPSSAAVNPQKADLLELGAQVNLSADMALSMEAYYKKLDNLYTYPETGALLLDATEDISGELLQGEGASYGIEWMIQKKGINWGAWLNYTLAWADRQFLDENIGLEYPFIFDQRHQLKGHFYYKFGRGLSLSFNAVYNSPTPQSAILSLEEELDGGLLLDPNPDGQRNQLRSVPYHRFDLNLHYSLKKGKLDHQIDLGVYNLFNRKNIAFYNVVFTDEDSNDFELIPVNGLPFLPSFSYLLKF